MHTTPTELPRLRLGTAGFDEAQLARLTAALGHTHSGLPWCIGGLDAADAWCLNGARTTGKPDGSLEVATAGGPFPIRIQASVSERPMAFAVPAARPLRDCGVTFDLASPDSTQAMLASLEGWLRPLAVQYWVGSQILQRHPDLNETVFHVSVQGKLVALISRHGVGVLPIADPLRLDEAVWARRPPEAGEIPAHFVKCSLAEVLWIYAMRTPRDLLSPALRSGPIHWCRIPPLPQKLFSDAHLLIARELAQAPATFAQLRGRTRLSDADLARALAALRVVGSIVSQSKWTGGAAARPPPRQRAASGSPAERAWSDKTAPAPLLVRAMPAR